MPRYVMGKSSWETWAGDYHRCSIPRCLLPAVCFYTGSYYRRQGGVGQRRRFLCERHTVDYRLVRRPSGWWYRYVDAYPLILGRAA